MAEAVAEPAALVAWSAKLGVVLEDRQAEAMLGFGDLLLRWNRAFNLVSRRDTPRLVTRHLLDSLTVLPWLTGKRILDLGTGAGLPGVPLAIAREDAHFTLIDLSERKIRFIRQVVRSLGLTNVTPRCMDVRDLPGREMFDTVTCRAVADVSSAWSLASPRLRPAGGPAGRPASRLVIMSRARADGADHGEDDIPRGARLEARPRVQVPGLDHLHELVVLRHAGAAAPGDQD